MRTLGIDLGSKTIGLALSDPDGCIATPLKTLPRYGGKRDIQAIVDLAIEHGVGGAVIGLPLGLDGEENEATRRVREFGTKLEDALGIPMIYIDERFTSVIAERAMLDADLSRRSRKERVDQVAAAIILQSHLDAAEEQGE